ncbi:MAG: YceD family protein [Verrucomicrobiota bacterium]
MSRNPLIVPILQISEEGIELEATVQPALLDLPQEDRLHFDHPVAVRLRLSRRNLDVTVRGAVETSATAQCDRCLDNFKMPLRIDDLCVFLEDVQTDEVDLTSPLREDIVLALPSRLLCAEQCLGLCPGCGKNRNRETCDCAESAAPEETPWGQLEQLDLSAGDQPDNRSNH